MANNKEKHNESANQITDEQTTQEEIQVETKSNSNDKMYKVLKKNTDVTFYATSKWISQHIKDQKENEFFKVI